MFYKKKARKMPVTIKLNPDTRNASGALVQCQRSKRRSYYASFRGFSSVRNKEKNKVGVLNLQLQNQRKNWGNFETSKKKNE